MKTKCSVILFLFWILLAATAFPDSALWIDLNPKSDSASTTFGKLVLDYLKRADFTVQTESISGSDIATRLAALKDKTTPLFVRCSLEDYLKLLGDRQLLSDLGLELMNPRLISVPFYLMGYGGKESNQAASHLEVAFITLPQDRANLEEADLLNMLSEVLGRPKNSISIYHERNPYTVAKKLYDRTYHMIGVYEDEPSTLLDEFETNLTDELKAPPAEFIPVAPANAVPQLNKVAEDRLNYVFYNYRDQPFLETTSVPPAAPLIAVVLQSDQKFPVLLSNVRKISKTAEEEFYRATSYAYFLLLPSLDPLQENEKLNAQRRYLLNSYLEEPENRFKSLGFLGYLLLMKDRKWGDSQQRELYEAKCDLLLRKLKLQKLTAKEIFEFLQIEPPNIDRRGLFTNDVSRLYEDALKAIDEGLKGDRDTRIQKLETARRDLVAALLQGEIPKNVKGSRGLWSASDYNPYYQLARVTFYLDLEQNHE